MPTTISPQQESNLFYAVNGPVSNLAQYLLLTFNRDGTQYNVPVYAGCLYTVQFYQVELQNYVTVTGKVVGISEEAIAVSCIKVLDEYGNVCLNANFDKLSGYLSNETYHIPIQNIAGIVRVPDEIPEPPVERSESFVAVLGLTATVCRAVIVKIKVLQDNIQHTVVPVDMEVGKCYHVTWENHVNHTLYELVGKLIRIEEVLLNGSETPENGYVRQDVNQSIGASGNIYDPAEFYSLPKHNPDGDRIKFVFDTSKDFVKLIDSVMLKDIRDVEVVVDPVPPTPPTPTPIPPFPPPIPPCPPPHPPIPPFPPVPPCPPPPPYPPVPPCPPCPPCPWPVDHPDDGLTPVPGTRQSYYTPEDMKNC